MKASELIMTLAELISQYGDLPVVIPDGNLRKKIFYIDNIDSDFRNPHKEFYINLYFDEEDGE